MRRVYLSRAAARETERPIDPPPRRGSLVQRDPDRDRRFGGITPGDGSGARRMGLRSREHSPESRRILALPSAVGVVGSSVTSTVGVCFSLGTTSR